MKNKPFNWLSLIVILVLVLTACARPAEAEETPEPTVVEQTATEAPTATQEPTATNTPQVEIPEVAPTETQAADDELSEEDERMQALISDKIGGCHMLNFILRQTKTREEWSVTIDRMIGKGAKINAEEKELIIDYLVSRNN